MAKIDIAAYFYAIYRLISLYKLFDISAIYIRELEKRVGRVTRLEDLLYEVDEQERDEAVRELRDVLRESGSFRGPKAVQFLLDSELVDDDIFTVRIERSGEAVYLPVGNLFVEEPNPVTPNHAVARK